MKVKKKKGSRKKGRGAKRSRKPHKIVLTPEQEKELELAIGAAEQCELMSKMIFIEVQQSKQEIFKQMLNVQVFDHALNGDIIIPEWMGHQFINTMHKMQFIHHLKKLDVE